MENTRKEIRGVNPKYLTVIQSYAEQNNMKMNTILVDVIEAFGKKISELQASEVLHSQIDDLITANNNLINSQNQNTLVIGESLKAFAEQLEETNIKLQALLNK